MPKCKTCHWYNFNTPQPINGGCGKRDRENYSWLTLPDNVCPDWEIKKAIAIDFDGCLFTNKWPDIGKPLLVTFILAQEARKQGAGLILWTCREGEMLKAAIEACSECCLEFDAVNESLPEWLEEYGTDPRKIGASEYWDDKAVKIGENTPVQIYDKALWEYLSERMAEGETIKKAEEPNA